MLSVDESSCLRAKGPNVVFFSVPPYFGTLTRFHAHPAGWLHKLPDGVSFEEGSLCEPLAVALAGIERADVRLGDPVLIWYASIRPYRILYTNLTNLTEL